MQGTLVSTDLMVRGSFSSHVGGQEPPETRDGPERMDKTSGTDTRIISSPDSLNKFCRGPERIYKRRSVPFNFELKSPTLTEDRPGPESGRPLTKEIRG